VAKRSVVVMGAGVTGLSVSVLLARDGHRVTLVDRDRLDVGEPLDSVDWPRAGIPHFLLPHAFIPRGRELLLDQFPDVYAALIGAGARDVDTRPKIPGPPSEGDEQLQYVAVRRPLIEWALRRAVHGEPLIDIRDATHVTGFSWDGGRVRGVQVDDGELAADVVVDALGRRSPASKWLGQRGIDVTAAESSDCSVIYYSRYYRQAPGFELPDGPWLFGPRGDLGYLGFSLFPGDNDTLAALLAVPTGDPQWRGLKNAEVFEAAVASIPAMRAWIDPAGVEPITGVLPMAGLRNTLLDAEPMLAAGLVPVGDAYGHLDPVLAHGLAFGMIHAVELTRCLDQYDDLDEALAAYGAATRPALRERFDFATELDAQRHRGWMGERVDVAHRGGDYALFSLVAAGAAASVDPEVFRVFVRRTGLLDSTGVLDDDMALQTRIEDLFAQILTTPRPAPGPSRAEMVALMTAAATD